MRGATSAAMSVFVILCNNSNGLVMLKLGIPDGGSADKTVINPGVAVAVGTGVGVFISSVFAAACTGVTVGV